MQKKTTEQIMAEAEAKVDRLNTSGTAIRCFFEAGRPNNAKESTVLGSLNALDILLEDWPPKPDTSLAKS